MEFVIAVVAVSFLLMAIAAIGGLVVKRLEAQRLARRKQVMDQANADIETLRRHLQTMSSDRYPDPVSSKRNRDPQTDSAAAAMLGINEASMVDYVSNDRGSFDI